jgi:hypothetical protein
LDGEGEEERGDGQMKRLWSKSESKENVRGDKLSKERENECDKQYQRD